MKKKNETPHKTPPHSPESEQAILGAILKENEAAKECSSMISAEHFYNDGHKIIYQALMDLLEVGKVDQVILFDHLKNHGNLEKAGGVSYISSLVDNVPSAANISRYAEIIKNKSDLRSIITTAQDMQDMAFSANGDSPSVILNTGRERLEKISTDDNKSLKFIGAATWLQTDPPQPDQVLENIFDMGDKIAIIAPSKQQKTFYLMHMGICLAAGRDFLKWKVSRPRKVAIIQLEVRVNHYWRRVRRLCRRLNIDADDLKDNLYILNARGLGISGTEGIERVKQSLAGAGFHPDVIMFDPLYKLETGKENASEDRKSILNAFDQLAEETGAAIVYTHHDPKGQAGDRDIRDRGAGSNVLNRDFDACFTLTAHASDDDAIVVDILLRNYRPQEPFTIQFIEDEHTGGYSFDLCPEILATKKTSANAQQQPAVDIYLSTALEILEPGMMEVALFKEKLKKQTGMSDRQLEKFMSWANAGGAPKLEMRSERGKGIHRKWIALQGTFKQ